MIRRILSTIVLWAIVFAVLYFGSVLAGMLVLTALTVLAQYETHVLLKKCGYAPWNAAALILGAILMLGVTFSSTPGNLGWLPAWIALAVGLLLLPKNPAAVPRLLGSVFAIIYIPDMIKYYGIILRDFGGSCLNGEGMGLIVWIIAVAKFTDVGGYVVGSALGGAKLAPSISPGKTWAGVLGGLAFAAGIAALGAKYAPAYLPSWFAPGKAALLALPIAAAAILSDLSESALKRVAQVKDSGNCIPGIGGALDLVDSLLLSAPVAYYVLKFLASH